MTRRQLALLLSGLSLVVGVLVGTAAAATAATTTAPHAALLTAPHAAPGPTAPKPPTAPKGTELDGGVVNIEVGGGKGKPANSIVILIGLTLLSVAPALLLLCTSFTKIFVVLSITRNALGLTSVPPNQVLAGLALFLSLFIMGPVLSAMNDSGVQPYLKGDKKQAEAFEDGVKPLREFMLKNTRKDEIALFTKVAKKAPPKTRDDVELTTLVPAFVLSELRAAFIIGFVVFIPFLVIDMVVSASLMSMGMMMLPPVSVALPFKLLLFVLANGWGLIITSLVGSYQ